MSYKQIKLIDFVPDPTLSAKDNAKARKYHYESELTRIRAAEIIQVAKALGNPIKVRGQQDD